MEKQLAGLVIITLLSMSAVKAATVEDYVRACTKNQGNRMGPDLCKCVGNIAIQRFSTKEFDYFYAVSAKDKASTMKYNSILNQQEKMNDIMFTMKGPSECAGKLSGKKKPNTRIMGAEGSATSSGAATSSAGAAPK